jgi:hypothetical protein
VGTRIMLGWRADSLCGGDRGRSEVEMAEAREEAAGDVDSTMTESATVRTTAAITITANSIQPEVAMGASAANV